MELVEKDARHHIPGGEGAADQHVGGDRVAQGKPKVAEIEQNKAREQQREGRRHRAVYPQRPYPEDRREKRPGDEEPPHILVRGLEETVVPREQHQAKRDPEGPVGGEGAVAEVIAGFHLLQARDHLRESAENQTEPDHRPQAHEPEIVELEDQRGETEAGEADHGGIAELGGGGVVRGHKGSCIGTTASSVERSPSRAHASPKSARPARLATPPADASDKRSMSAPAVVNLSAYRFTPFAAKELIPLRDRLRTRTAELGLRGTILLATEGINLFVAGPRGATEALLADLRALPGLADLTPKESLSAEQPFNRMLVKVKKEIIAFGVEGIDPARAPAPRLDPRTLKQWLDEGRPVALLDTRNDYEVKLGTFRNALVPHIENFRDFPAAVRALPSELKNQPVVTFCTGGIRCEKAAPLLVREGFQNVYQLEGGILKYFELCGGAHYDGECFVFDRRVGVDPGLRETAAVLCFACQMPLTVAEQSDPRYVPDIACPHCAPGTPQDMVTTKPSAEKFPRQEQPKANPRVGGET